MQPNTPDQVLNILINARAGYTTTSPAAILNSKDNTLDDNNNVSGNKFITPAEQKLNRLKEQQSRNAKLVSGLKSKANKTPNKETSNAAEVKTPTPCSESVAPVISLLSFKEKKFNSSKPENQN